MIKLLIIYLTAMKISVESCSPSSSTSRPRPAAAPEYSPSELCAQKTFKEYKNRANLISELPDTKRIGELSLVGTHESVSYSLPEHLKRQEMDITNQLMTGVRFLDFTLYVVSNTLMVSSGKMKMDTTFSEVIDDINTFLSYNPNETVFGKVSYHPDELKTDVCKLINQFRAYNIGGTRLTSDWNLNDALGSHRGKILLASEDKLFKSCAFSFRNCLTPGNIKKGEVDIDLVRGNLDREWIEYLAMVNSSFTDNYPCNVYDLSIKRNYFSAKHLAKYGGFIFGKQNNGDCVEPVNFKAWKLYPKCNLNELNVLILDFPTQEIIDRVNEDNFFAYDLV